MAWSGHKRSRRGRPQLEAFRSAAHAVRGLIIAVTALSVLLSAGLIITGVARHGVAANDVARLVILVLGAIGYEEIARSMGRARGRLFAGIPVIADMASVWAVCAALVLPIGWASLVVTIHYSWQWRRQLSDSGSVLFRKVYSVGYFALACVAATAVRDQLLHRLPADDLSLSVFVAFVLAAVAYHVVNLASLGAAIAVSGGDPRPVFRVHALELAVISMGVLSAVAMQGSALLVLLVILPLYLLQRAALVNQLEKAATTDAKTGLLNAATWQHAAEQRLMRAVNEQLPAALMIIDLDLFKSVNDRHGHLAGDKVLAAVATTLSHQMRDADILGRFGGEEFIVFVPNVEPSTSFAIAERIRLAINGLTLSAIIQDVAPADDRALSASLGVACHPFDGHELTALMHAADLALYVAKDSGRNRAVFATPHSES